jgi:hypothetical protein
MKGMVPDISIQGQFTILLLIAEGPYWQEVWRSLNLSVETFGTLGLSPSADDTEVYQLCRARELVLITGNRNHDGPDSLEEAIRSDPDPKALPVLTIADPEAVRHSRAYAERVVASMLDYLIRNDEVRGTGRLYIP